MRNNLQFDGSANVYCKYCDTWGNTEQATYADEPCGNCSQKGYLILNPFPDNMIPYIVFEPKEMGNQLNEN